MKSARLVVFISGHGSNLQAIMDAIQQGFLRAEIIGVIANKHDAWGIQRAKDAQLPVYLSLRTAHASRDAYDAALAQATLDLKPDWIVLAGWMHLFSKTFLQHFPNRVINLHPALPGQFPGVRAIERAYEAFQRGDIQETGVMLHYVPDEGIDSGPVIAQQSVPFMRHDTLDDFKQRMHATEHRLLIDQLQLLTKDPI